MSLAADLRTPPSTTLEPPAPPASLVPAGAAPSGVVPSGPAPSDPAPASAAPDTERLGDEIAELASRIQAATYELLVLIRRFDERGGWSGFVSGAHWLNWRAGLALGAAREKVRVARALGELPLLSEAMRRGRISYSKVRAVTRVATPESERRLLDLALCAPASYVERVTRAWRQVDEQAEANDDRRRHARRELRTWVDDDGMVVIRGRLSPEVGAVVRRALEAADDRLRSEAPADGARVDGEPETSPGQRRADALGLVAEAALAADLDRGTAGDRYQVVLHVEADALRADAGDGAPDVSAETSPRVGHAALEEADGLRVSAETARRMACDASAVVMRHGPDGSVLDVGRKTRTIPPALGRALRARDRACRFPGCTARRCDAHHVRHWADGGTTRLDNLVLLCRRHHRAVHEEGFTVALEASGEVAFRWPDGQPFLAAPAWSAWSGSALAPTGTRLAAAGIAVGPATATPHWHGERLDLAYVIDVLWTPRAGAAGDAPDSPA